MFLFQRKSISEKVNFILRLIHTFTQNNMEIKQSHEMKGIHLTNVNEIKCRILLKISLRYSQTALCKRAARRKRKQAPRASNKKHTDCSPSLNKSCENKTKIQINSKNKGLMS